MTEENDLEDINNNINQDEENPEEDEDYDEDIKINDYEGQDGDIDNSNKKIVSGEEDEDLFELNQDEDFEKKYTNQYHQNPKKEKSGYPILSFFEYSKIFSELAKYIADNKISVPESMIDEEEVLSGDVIRISRFWIKNRKRWPLPITIPRHLYKKKFEIIDPNKLPTEDELSFRDENDDTFRFDYNFRDKPYENSA